MQVASNLVAALDNFERCGVKIEAEGDEVMMDATAAAMLGASGRPAGRGRGRSSAG